MTMPTYTIAHDFGLQTLADFPADYAKYSGCEFVPEYGDNEEMPEEWCERFRFELYNGRQAFIDVGNDYYWVGLFDGNEFITDENVYSCDDIAKAVIKMNEGN